MIILIVVFVFLALVAAVPLLIWSRTKLAEKLHASMTELERAHTQARSDRASADASRERCSQLEQAGAQAASQAQEQFRQILAQLDHSMAATGQAMNIARHVEVISNELQLFFDYVRFERQDAEAALPARHASDHPQTGRPLAPPTSREIQQPDADDADGYGEAPEIPHAHVTHQRSSNGPWPVLPGATISGGEVSYVRREAS